MKQSSNIICTYDSFGFQAMFPLEHNAIAGSQFFVHEALVPGTLVHKNRFSFSQAHMSHVNNLGNVQECCAEDILAK